MDRAINPFDGSRKRLKSVVHKTDKDYSRDSYKLLLGEEEQYMYECYVIRDSAQALGHKYRKSYKKFCEDNPGYIMHNDGIRDLACTNILKECTDLSSLIKFRDERLEMFKESSGPNGHKIHADVAQEIINMFKEEEE